MNQNRTLFFRKILIIVSRIMIVLTIFLVIVHYLFAWLNFTVDTWVINHFAHLISDGKYLYNYPTNYLIPTTIEAPLYSVLLGFLYRFQRSDILLHALQLLMLVISGIVLFQILRTYIYRPVAIIISCIFIWLPANLIFASYVLTDFMAQFLFTLYVYLVFLFLRTKNVHYLILSIFLGTVTGLCRYSFLVFGLFSLTWFLTLRSRVLWNWILAFLGLLPLAFWIVIHYHLTGIVGISDTTGVRIFNQVVRGAQVLPSDDSAAMKELRQYLPHASDEYLMRDWWEFQNEIDPNPYKDLEKINRVLGAVGIAALKEHPVEVLELSVKMFFAPHWYEQIPWWLNLKYFGLPIPRKILVRYFGNECLSINSLTACAPILSTRYSYPVWNGFVTLSETFHSRIFPLWSFWIFFPSLLISLLLGDKLSRIYSLLFIMGRIPIALIALNDPRYLIPFYPLMIIITITGGSIIHRLIKKSLNSIPA